MEGGTTYMVILHATRNIRDIIALDSLGPVDDKPKYMCL
jgi:hypothetical protein